LSIRESTVFRQSFRQALLGGFDETGEALSSPERNPRGVGEQWLDGGAGIEYDGLAVALMGLAASAGLAALSLYVAVADAKHPRWWVVLLLAAISGGSLLLGLGLWFGSRLLPGKDRLAVQVEWGSMNVVATLPDDHPRKGQNTGAVLVNGIRFTSLEDEDVSLGINLLADFPGWKDPARFYPERLPSDLSTPINLSPSHPGVTGDLSFQWSPEHMEMMGQREVRDVFSLRIIDQLSDREATVPFGGVITTDKL
jgi:hypothetical protein